MKRCLCFLVFFSSTLATGYCRAQIDLQSEIDSLTSKLIGLPYGSDRYSLAQEVIHLSHQMDNKKSLVKGYYESVKVLEKLGLYKNAKKEALMAIKLADEIEDKDMLSISYLLMGNICIATKEFEDGKAYFLKAYENAALKRQKVLSKRGVGLTLIHLNRLEESIEVLKEGLQLSGQDSLSLAAHWLTLGMAYEKGEDFFEAEKNYKKVLNLSGNVDSAELKAQALLNLGCLYLSSNKYYKARKELNRGLELAEELEKSEYVSQFFLSLSDLEEKTLDYKQAVEYLNAHSAKKSKIKKQNRKERSEIYEIDYNRALNEGSEQIEKSKNTYLDEQHKMDFILTLLKVLFTACLILIAYFIYRNYKRLVNKKKELASEVNSTSLEVNFVDSDEQNFSHLNQQESVEQDLLYAKEEVIKRLNRAALMGYQLNAPMVYLQSLLKNQKNDDLESRNTIERISTDIEDLVANLAEIESILNSIRLKADQGQ